MGKLEVLVNLFKYDLAIHLYIMISSITCSYVCFPVCKFTF